MDVTDVIGPFGKIQMRIFLIVSLRPIAWGLLKMNYYFIVQPKKFLCADFDYPNGTSPFDQVSNQCTFKENGSSTLQECKNWVYDDSDGRNLLVDEWDLVCGNAWAISFGYMVYSIGNFIAYLPSGQFADKFGRRPITIFGQILAMIMSVLVPLSGSMTVFLVIRGLTGFFQGLAQNAFLCLFLEAVGPKHRDYLMYSFSGAWGLGIVIVSGLAWLVTNWRTLSWICSIPIQLPLLLGIWWFAPESTKWLVTAKKYDRAEKQLVEHAKVNGKRIDDIDLVMNELKKKIEQDKRADKATFVDVITNKYLRKKAIILYATFVLTVFVSHGFTITVGKLGGSIYFNMCLDGLSEIGVIILYHIIVRNLNRRYGLCLSYALAGIAFLLVSPVPPELHWLKITFAMTGKLTNSLAYVIIYIFSAELFPTNVRAVAISGAMTAGRIGSILAPFADVLSTYYGNTLSVILYGCISLITAGLILLLPETRDIQLPDTVVESERIEKNSQSQSVVV